MSKSNFFLGALFGAGAAYIYHLRKVTEYQAQIIELSKPPAVATKADWWENYQPETDDEYTVTLAKRDWLRGILVKYVYPYINENAASILMLEMLMPLNDRLTKLEMSQSKENRIFEHMLNQKAETDKPDKNAAD